MDSEGMQLEFGASGEREAARREARRRRSHVTRGLMRCLKHDARHLCSIFSLRYRSLEAERRGVTSRYGACFSDGTIKIRLYHAVTGKPLRYSSLIDTLCHELAHLRHFNHGPEFQELYHRILECARREGIYRPHERRRRAGSKPAGLPAPAARDSGESGATAEPARTTSRVRAPAAREQMTLFG